MPEFPRKDFRLHVGWRTIKTAVSAMLVNYFLLRPRVVSLWEGFKDSFKKDSNANVKSKCEKNIKNFISGR